MDETVPPKVVTVIFFSNGRVESAKRSEIEKAAEVVLIAREMHTEKTLAQMYDPDKMPANLRETHTHLDRVVESCYRPAPFTSDEERRNTCLRCMKR